MPESPAQNLEGWIPPLASDADVRLALEKAFDYRGDVSITLKDGRKIEGYIFDRRSDGPGLERCVVRIFQKDSDQKHSITYSEIARIEFSGRDPAAGKSFQTWIAKYRQKKAAGETNICLEPEQL